MSDSTKTKFEHTRSNKHLLVMHFSKKNVVIFRSATTSSPPPAPEITTTRFTETLEALLPQPLTQARLPLDPCQPANHYVIENEPRRSFNQHMSLGDHPPICDTLIKPGWYRFQSQAGNLMPTECPGGNYCGTEMPIWMKGECAISVNMSLTCS